nr:hypothetical protein FACS18942_10270 [Planctomycetales bacterium]GHT37548.1 hypothetical protein FACS189427_10630 [Planctomycetales bacterium]
MYVCMYVCMEAHTFAQTSDSLVFHQTGYQSQKDTHPFFEQWNNVREDHRNYYSKSVFWKLGLAIGVHAAVSNTSIDRQFRNWYQNDIRSSRTDDVSKNFKVLGEGSIWLPVFGAAALTSCLGQKFCPSFRPANGVIGEFAVKTTRSYLVGTPTLLLGQFCLGSSRPSDLRSYHSAWRPFQDDNSFSGHAFIGATPFLTAAAMTDKIWLKSVFYTCSTFAGISRINDDAHYTSQVLLGWYIAYLSVQSISKTDNILERRGLTVFPVLDAKYVGIGISLTR